MRNITLAIDEDTLAQGREYAANIGLSFNALVRQLIERTVKKAEKEQWLEETNRLFNEAHGNSGDWKWNREEIYDR